MLSFLLGLIPGALTTINGITNAISNEKIAALTATTQQEQIASQERVASLQAQRDALIAETRVSKLPIFIQTAIAAGPAFILCKIFFYDELGFGTTEIPNNSNLWNVIMVVVGFYFLHSVADMWTKSK
jgi:Ni/Fe-hydrogenase subunit HybB-like protein